MCLSRGPGIIHVSIHHYDCWRNASDEAINPQNIASLRTLSRTVPSSHGKGGDVISVSWCMALYFKDPPLSHPTGIGSVLLLDLGSHKSAHINYL